MTYNIIIVHNLIKDVRKSQFNFYDATKNEDIINTQCAKNLCGVCVCLCDCFSIFVCICISVCVCLQASLKPVNDHVLLTDKSAVHSGGKDSQICLSVFSIIPSL